MRRRCELQLANARSKPYDRKNSEDPDLDITCYYCMRNGDKSTECSLKKKAIELRKK